MVSGKKYIKVLLYVGGVILALLVWRFVYTPKVEANAKFESENATLKDNLNWLIELDENKEKYKEKAEKAEAQIEEITGEFAPGLLEEDIIMHANALESVSDMHIGKIDLNSYDKVGNSVEGVYNGTEGLPEGTDASLTGTEAELARLAPPAVGYTLYKVEASYNCTTSYQSLKDVLNTITEDDNRKVLSSLNMSYDLGSGGLTGDINVDFYFLYGTDEVYQKQQLPNMNIGTDNICGTVVGGVQ